MEPKPTINLASVNAHGARCMSCVPKGGSCLFRSLRFWIRLPHYPKASRRQQAEIRSNSAELASPLQREQQWCKRPAKEDPGRLFLLITFLFELVVNGSSSRPALYQFASMHAVLCPISALIVMGGTVVVIGEGTGSRNLWAPCSQKNNAATGKHLILQ